MNTFDNDPRETAVWTPGSLVITRPESNRSGSRAEDALILQTLDEVRRKRRRRFDLVGRLKLITRNA